jgi:hypothetical protein
MIVILAIGISSTWSSLDARSRDPQALGLL